ncbi:MAG TPA: Hsp20/alpha crystallin family protein [Chthoniobacterales bacterium]
MSFGAVEDEPSLITMEKIRVTQLQRVFGDLAYELRNRYQTFQPRTVWTPAINAFCCRDHILVCVELAGVEAQSIELRPEPRRLVIRGLRIAPEPDDCEGPLTQVLALEIDHGLFEREVALPVEIDPGRVRIEQRNGLLWIYLPVQSQS